MKKFITLFAMLSFVMSASAEVFPTLSAGEKKIYLEEKDNLDKPSIYYWVEGSNNPFLVVEGGWPGVDMEYIGINSDGHKVYVWEMPENLGWTPSHIIFTVKKDDNPSEARYQSKNLVFQNGAYYVDIVSDKAGDMNPFYIVDKGYTVYFDKTGTNWGDVNIYSWDPDNNNATFRNKGFPGIPMVSLGNNLYMYHISNIAFDKIIFSNANNQGEKTDDLDAVDGKTYIVSGQTSDYSLNLDDTQGFSAANDFIASSATYTRTCPASSSWGSLCLPFSFDPTNQQGVTFYEMTAVNSGSSAITFSKITDPIDAGTPVAFKLATPGSTLTITSENATVVSQPHIDGVVPDDYSALDWYMTGTFMNYTPQSGVYVFQSNKICYTGDYTPTISPYRAWIVSQYNAPADAPFRIEVAGETEGLQFVEQEDGTVKAYYDLQGRKLNERKGLMIENGKIIMVK